MNDNERDAKINDHEGRIRNLEIDSTEIKTILKQTNKILGGIATMIGGVILKFIVDTLTK